MTTQLAPGLKAWTVELETGGTQTVLASSMQAAIGHLPVKNAGAAVFNVDANPPVLASLVPASAKIGDPSFTLHVHGTGFQTGDRIVWNGGVEVTTLVSPTELTTSVNMATATTAVPIPVAVRTITGADSNSLTFDLQPAA